MYRDTYKIGAGQEISCIRDDVDGRKMHCEVPAGKLGTIAVSNIKMIQMNCDTVLESDDASLTYVARDDLTCGKQELRDFTGALSCKTPDRLSMDRGRLRC